MTNLLYAVNVAKKVLVRNKGYVVSCVFFTLLTNVYLAYYFYFNSSAVQYLSYSMRLGQISLVFFSFFSFEYHSFMNSEIIEITQTHHGETNKLLSSRAILSITILLIWAVNVLAWQFGFYYYHDFSYPSFKLQLFSSIVLNCVLPGLVGIAIGVLFALTMNRSKAYCFIVFILLVSSNIPAQLFTLEEIAGTSILDIFDWFSLLAPNLNYVADSIYGIANELHRWLLAIGWLSALLLVSCLKIRKDSPSLNSIIIVLLVLCVICFMRFSKRDNDSIIRKDFRPNGTICSEVLYRRENPSKKEEKSNFEIVSYDLNINITTQIEATAILHVDLPNLDQYRFTLWHSLKVEEITDELGRLLDFERDGDFLTVYTPKGAEVLHMTYRGNCGKYFSNYQGIALPGYVPYYPWAGHIIIWDEYHEEIKNDHRNPMSSFRVQITSPLVAACNLPSIEQNIFAGCAESLSLYAGLIAPFDVGSEVCYCSPVSAYHLNIDGYEKTWANIASLVGETRTLDLSEKIIFVQPETIMVTGNIRERMVLFSDHIILGSWVTNEETVCLYYLLNLIPQRNETYLLYDLFQTEIISNSGNKSVDKKPGWDSLRILTEYALPNEIIDEETQGKFAAAAATFWSLWEYQINTLGADVVLREVYQYMLSPDLNQNQIEFLYNLGG